MESHSPAVGTGQGLGKRMEQLSGTLDAFLLLVRNLERLVGRTAIGTVRVVAEEKRHINSARIYVVDAVPDCAPNGIRVGVASDLAGECPCEANAGMTVLGW